MSVLHEETIEGSQMLLPEMANNNDSRIKEILKKIAILYLGESEANTFSSEYEIWQNHWESMPEKPSNTLETLDQCKNQFFLTTKKLLIILATLPVMTAAPERCFQP